MSVLQKVQKKEHREFQVNHSGAKKNTNIIEITDSTSLVWAKILMIKRTCDFLFGKTNI